MLEFLLKPSNKVKSIKTALFIHFPLFYVHDGLRCIFLNSFPHSLLWGKRFGYVWTIKNIFTFTGKAPQAVVSV